MEDQSHIIYVNGEYRGDSDLGRLISDLNNKSFETMNFKLFADSMRYLKANPKGVLNMCKAFEKVHQQGIQEGIQIGTQDSLVGVALRMLATGKYALEEIVAMSGLSLDQVKALRDGQLV